MQNALLMNLAVPLGDGHYSIEIKTLKKNDFVPAHWHNYFEFEIILNGRTEHTYNGSTYIAEKGSAYLLGFYDFHAVRVIEDTTLLKITFDAEALDKKISSVITMGNGNGLCNLTDKEIDYIKDRVRVLNAEELNKEPFSDHLQRSALTEIMIHILRKTLTDGTPKTPNLIQQTVSYMHTHFREDISLNDTAAHLSVSVNHLGVLFKKHIKMSFHTYLNILRLKYACELLMSTDLSVKEIAFESGYTSVEYFLYVFKKQFDRTPTNYRKTQKTDL